MSVTKEQIDEELVILSRAMDNQQKFYDELYSFVDKHGAEMLPEEYTKAWLLARLQGRKPWRSNVKIVKRIKRTAKKNAINRSKGLKLGVVK